MVIPKEVSRSEYKKKEEERFEILIGEKKECWLRESEREREYPLKQSSSGA